MEKSILTQIPMKGKKSNFSLKSKIKTLQKKIIRMENKYLNFNSRAMKIWKEDKVAAITELRQTYPLAALLKVA